MRKILFILFLTGVSHFLLAQNSYNLIPLEDFINQLEQKFSVKCFYNEEWLYKYEVINSIDKSTVDSVLQEGFSNNSFLKYFIYQDRYVIFSEIESVDLRKKNIQVNSEEVEYQTKSQNTKNEKIIYKIGTPGLNEKVSTISGTIVESISKQSLPGVSVIADEGSIGTTTNENGEYKIFLSKGYHVLTFSYMGMEPTLRKVQLYSSGTLDLAMDQKVNFLEEIKITGQEAKREKQIIGYKKLKTLEINEVPSFMGEVDIIKYSLLLPGIQSVGEMDMSFSVRGGKGDQNLILIDGMHTYSNSHFFGLFPGINPYSVEDATLYRASMPIEYGNRLSSVYDIKIKEGNYKKIELEGGISPVSSNISFNGPIIKDKLNINTSYRGTYSNWILDLIDVEELNNSSVSFYDYNVKLSYKPNLSNLYSVFYTKSYDDFLFNDQLNYKTYNNLLSINIKNYLKNDNILETTIGYSFYNIERSETPSREYSATKEHSIKDIKLSSKLLYNYNLKNLITTGIEFVYHEISPWNINPMDSYSLIKPKEINKSKGVELSYYIGDKISLMNRLTLDVGIRLSTYTYLGPNDKYIYKDGITLENNIIDTIKYSNNEIIDFNWGPELRISGNYELRNDQNINFSYNRNRQYISILTNTQAITPIGSWQLSNEHIPPQIADHYSIGYNKDIYKKAYTISVEAYYKKIKNIKDFKNGSKFELNPHPETEIVNALGKTYGAELMFEKNTGRLTGWISYTYSRAFIKTDNDISEKVINDGNYYPASYDKPHNLSAVVNLEPTKRFKISSVVNFSSGIPVTLPVSKISIDNNYYIVYSDRNQFRLPYYLRLDMSVSIRGSLKRNKIVTSLWTLSVYNVLGRHNPYSLYFESEGQQINGYQLSIFGEPIPTITYKFNF